MKLAGKIAVSFLSMMTIAQAQKISVPFEKYRLDNGLTVILHEDHRLPLAAVNLWYRVGAKDEPVGRSGFAHLFEHLMFMGTWRAPEGQFDQLMEKGGGSNNATTSADRTNYYSWGPANLLPTLLWLEADRLEHLGDAMNQQKLDLQREVVRNERRQSYENEPYGMAELEVDGLMYPPGHPYHLPVIGSHEDLIAASVKDVKDFFATFYVPNNCSLVVAGDFDPVATKKLIAAIFGSLPKRPNPTHKDAAPVRLEHAKEKSVTDPNVQFPRVSMIWHSPKSFAPGDAECDLLAKILGDGIISRLQKRLIYDETLANSVGVSQQSQRLGSMFRIDVIAAEGVPPGPIEAAIDSEVELLKKNGPTDAELSRIKAAIETESVLGLQRMLERADRLNSYEAILGDPNGFEKDLGRYRAATRESLREWANKVLDPNARLILRVFPEKSAASSKSAAESEPDDGPEHAPESRAEAAASMPATRPAASRPALPPSPRDAQPAIAPAAPFRPIPCATFPLGDARVLLHERHELPLVRIIVRIGGGSNLDPKGKGGLVDLTAALLKEGAGSRDALAFSDAMDQLGAMFDTAADSDSTLLQLTVVKANLAKAVDLLLDAVLEPRFDAAAFKRVKTQLLGALQQRDDQPSIVGRLVSQAVLLGRDHPNGRPVDGTVGTVSTIELADVKAAWGAHVSRDLQLLLAGDISKAEAEALFGPRLASRPKPPPTGMPPLTGAVPAERAAKLRFVIVNRPNSPQTVIRFAWPGVAYSDDRRIPLLIGTSVLGGTFTSRLNYNLREQKGYTYGAGAGVEYYTGSEDPQRGPSVVAASASVRADVTGASLREFLAEFARIRTGDVTADELEKARSSLRNMRVTAGESLDGLVAELDGNGSGIPPPDLGPDMRAQPTYGYPGGLPKAPPPPPPPAPPKGPKKLRPETLAPYFLLAALIHMAAVATRFDALAAKLPAAVAPALMIVQFPLLMLSGFFEGRLQYEHNMSSDFPLWMRIRSKPVKLAFTFAFIYIALIPLQTWNISIGPLDPTPPESFPLQQRAMWFTMFTAGMFFPFYLAATGLLVPVLRTVTAPLHYLPALVGGLVAIAVGAGLGVLVFAASSSTAVGELIKSMKEAVQEDPVIGLLVILNTLVVPLLVALFRKDD